MAQPVLMPKQGITVESCIITSWAKKPGDAVKIGEILFSYETDKATFDVEAEAEGTLIEVFYPEGEDIPVLTAVAAIGSPGEDVSGFDPRGAAPTEAAPVEAAPTQATAPAAAAQAAPVAVAAAAVSAAAAVQAAPAASTAAAQGISPRARALASAMGIDASQAAPTGPEGRIIERDVRTLIATGAPQAISVAASTALAQTPAASAAAYRDEKLSGVRNAISKGMMHSLTSMAQLTLTTSFDATAILAQRKVLKASADEQISGITLGDMVLYAVVRALQLPANAHFNAHLIEGNTMRYFDAVNLAFACDTPRGLLVPTIYNAQTMTLRQLSQEVKRLAGMAQTGQIAPDLLTNGTFTVTNLGGMGIEHFTPVINPPQTGILGVNNITWRPRNAQGDFYPAMGLSLTFDHRAVDGAPAARLLGDISRMLENFTALLAG